MLKDASLNIALIAALVCAGRRDTVRAQRDVAPNSPGASETTGESRIHPVSNCPTGHSTTILSPHVATQSANWRPLDASFTIFASHASAPAHGDRITTGGHVVSTSPRDARDSPHGRSGSGTVDNTPSPHKWGRTNEWRTPQLRLSSSMNELTGRWTCTHDY